MEARSPDLRPRAVSRSKLQADATRSTKLLRNTVGSLERRKQPPLPLYPGFAKCASQKTVKRAKPRPQTKVVNLNLEPAARAPSSQTRKLKIHRNSLANESSLIRAISLLTPPAELLNSKKKKNIRSSSVKKKTQKLPHTSNQTLDDTLNFKPFLNDIYSSSSSSDDSSPKPTKDSPPPPPPLAPTTSTLKLPITKRSSCYLEEQTPEFGSIEKENTRPPSAQPIGPPSSFYPGPRYSQSSDQFPSSPFSSSDKNPMITPTYTTLNHSPAKAEDELKEILIEEEFMTQQPVFPHRPSLKTQLFWNLVNGLWKRQALKEKAKGLRAIERMAFLRLLLRLQH